MEDAGGKRTGELPQISHEGINALVAKWKRTKEQVGEMIKKITIQQKANFLKGSIISLTSEWVPSEC
jgi:hypothetical protein